MVAHLDAKSTPVITPYVNNNEDIPAGGAWLTVPNIASAAHFDVVADGDVPTVAAIRLISSQWPTRSTDPH